MLAQFPVDSDNYLGNITSVVGMAWQQGVPGMAKTRMHRLGNLQLKILKILWEIPEASVADVHQQLWSAEHLAYTTVATMLRKMEARGLVQHRVDERRFLYRAAVSSEDVTR